MKNNKKYVAATMIISFFWKLNSQEQVQEQQEQLQEQVDLQSVI